MWLVGVLGSFVLAVWLVIMGLAHLVTRYEHSKQSKTVLGVIALLACGMAVLVVRNWPALPLWGAALLVAVFTVPIFTAMAVGCFQLWTLRKQSHFDEQLERLEQEEVELLQQLDDIRTAVHAEALRLREREPYSQKRENDGDKYRAVIEKWQQGEGVARIRSLRVSEWEDQYRGCTQGELTQRRSELLEQAHDARRKEDADQADIINAEIAVVRLCELERAEPDAVKPEGGADHVDRLLNKQDQLSRELEQLRGKVNEWKMRKQDFLARKIKL